MKLSKFFYPTVSVLSTLMFGGCAANRSVLGHRSPLSAQIRIDLTPEKEIAEWRNNYYTANSENDRRFYRNQILRRLMRLDDESFSLWSQKLYGTRSVSGAAGDFATGLMGAFAATSGASAAQSLGLAITGLSAARSAADKELFLQKSAGALVSKMKEDRAKVDAQITQYLSKDTVSYPLEQGVRDFLRYYEAGTLASASETLQSDAKVAELGAQGLVDVIKGDRVVAPSQIARAANRSVLPHRSEITILTDEQLLAQKEIAAEKRKAQQALAILLDDTFDKVNAVRVAIEAADPDKHLDYDPIMDAVDPKKKYARTQNGLSQLMKANSDNPEVLKKVRAAANAQMPVTTPASNP